MPARPSAARIATGMRAMGTSVQAQPTTRAADLSSRRWGRRRHRPPAWTASHHGRPPAPLSRPTHRPPLGEPVRHVVPLWAGRTTPAWPPATLVSRLVSPREPGAHRRWTPTEPAGLAPPLRRAVQAALRPRGEGCPGGVAPPRGLSGSRPSPGPCLVSDRHPSTPCGRRGALARLGGGRGTP